MMYLKAVIYTCRLVAVREGRLLYKAEHSDTAFLTDRVLADLLTRADGWCAHVTYIRPHPPFVAPAPYNRSEIPHPSRRLQLEGSTSRHSATRILSMRRLWITAPEDMVCGFPQIEDLPETTGVLRALYLGLIAELDHHFGRIITHLKQTGQYDNTLIVITSDHGEMLGDQLLGQVELFRCGFPRAAGNPPAGRWQGGP